MDRSGFREYLLPAKEPPMEITTLLDLVEHDKNHECEGVGKDHICVKIAATAHLPSRFGDFQVVGFTNNRDGKDHAAFVHGDVVDQEDVPIRMHSECLTGDAIGSLRCDCRDQLEAALTALGKMERGILFYLRQEGRGISLTNKIRAYQLQDEGLDTVEANHALGFRDDERDYSVAAHMISSLRVKSVALMTNNPKKLQGLESLGIKVSRRIPHIMKPNEFNQAYLKTKQAKSGHMLAEQGEEA
jgi:GTP cyclohydrolase II